MAENENNVEDDLTEVLSEKFQELNDNDAADISKPEPAQQEKATEDAPAAQEKETGQKDEIKDAGTAPVQAAIEPPVSWPAADKAMWKDLPPKVQEIVARRESDRDKFLTQKSNEFTQQLAPYKEIDHALAPVEQILRREGVSKSQAVKELVAYYQHYESNPVSYILQVAQSKGIDLAKLVNGQLDPNKIAFQQYDQKFTKLQQDFSELKEQKELEVTQMLQGEIDRFKSEPNHEHFNAVSVHMGKLIAAGEANDMQSAYEMAVWANSATRALELKKQETERAQVNDKKAKEAKKASGPKLKTVEFSAGKSTSASDDDEFLREEYRRINGG